MADDRSLPRRAAAIRRPVPLAFPAQDADLWRASGEAGEGGEPRWRGDLRLFTFTFAGGFVFFLTFLA